MFRLITLTALLLTTSYFISCDDGDIDPDDCSGNILCTEEFRTVVVELRDLNDDPLVLDDWITINTMTGDTLLLGPAYPDGVYPVVSDGQLELVNFDGTRFTFVGYIAGQNIFSADFLVGRDCCHIFLIEGETTFTLALK